MSDGAAVGATKTALIIAIGALAALIALGFLTMRDDQRMLDQISKDGRLWSAARLELQLQRVLLELTKIENEAAVTPDAAMSQIDVLWSRIAVFNSGELGARMRALDEDGAARDLEAALVAAEPMVAKLGAGDRSVAGPLRRAIATSAPKLAELTVAASALDGVETLALTDKLRAGGVKGFLMMVASILLLLAIGGAVYLENRRQIVLARIAKKDAERLKDESEKSFRFLTTMSHELRTPLNGVLGLIALARSERSEADASAFLDKAEWSAQRLLHMITDAFEFVGGEETRTAPRACAFRVDDLAAKIRDRLLRDAAANGVAAHVHVSGDGAAAAIGDCEIFADAVARFGSHISESVGVERVSVELAYKDYAMTAAIRVVHMATSGWSLPKEPFTGDAVAGERFAADSLGPALARRHIASIKGVVEVGRISAGVSSVTVRAPMPAARQQPHVRVDVESGMVRHLCETALKQVGAVVAAADAPPEKIDAVIVEPSFGGADAATVAARRSANPGVSIIAAGAPQRPELYDGAVVLPGDADRLRAYLGRVG